MLRKYARIFFLHFPRLGTFPCPFFFSRILYFLGYPDLYLVLALLLFLWYAYFFLVTHTVARPLSPLPFLCSFAVHIFAHLSLHHSRQDLFPPSLRLFMHCACEKCAAVNQREERRVCFFIYTTERY
jgi:hypothetical protein